METTIQDVAHKAGVSISTVSRAFTRPDLVSDKTRERILAVAHELHFSLSRSAAALKSGKSLRIAFLVSGHINTWFISSLLEGLNDIFHNEGYDISIFQISSAEERKEFFENLPLRRNADAVIVASFGIDKKEIQRLNSIHIPVIGINADNPKDLGFTAAVYINNIQGSQLAARHLIQLGHKNILYISSSPNASLHFSVQTRIDSFIQYCTKHDINIQHISCSTDHNGTYAMSEVVSQIMSLPVLPTAIACQEDAIAIALKFQLERSGLHIPHDISLIGFDDSYFAQDLGLTTIRQSPVDIARTAAIMTLHLIDGTHSDELFISVPAQLIIRSTTTSAQ